MHNDPGQDSEEINQSNLPSNLGPECEQQATHRAMVLMILFAGMVVLSVVCGFIAVLNMLVDGTLVFVWLGASIGLLGIGAFIAFFPPRKH